ncbi:MAG: hypothetical protein LLG09_04265 [Negativicutes bacterium]|nr:hypothetical protein [Negativicutes bacterium]
MKGWSDRMRTGFYYRDCQYPFNPEMIGLPQPYQDVFAVSPQAVTDNFAPARRQKSYLSLLQVA